MYSAEMPASKKRSQTFFACLPIDAKSNCRLVLAALKPRPDDVSVISTVSMTSASPSC